MPDTANNQAPWWLAPTLGGVSQLGGTLGNLFHSGKSPEDAASPYFKQIQDMLPGYYNPYIHAGHEALGNLQSQYGSLASDPSQKLQEIGSQYHESPGFGFERDQALQAIQNAQAAGGMSGSPMHQQLAGQMAGHLADQDYNQYLQHALGLHGMGLQGEMGLSQMGYGASSELAENLANSMMSQANLAHASAENRRQRQGGFWGSLLGGLGSAAEIGAHFL